MTDGEISRKVSELFDMRPRAIEDRFELRTPIYEETATYGHVGRSPRTVTKSFNIDGKETPVTVNLFKWEELDRVDDLCQAFSL